MSAAEQVVVIGAGASGLSTAGALARRGVDALVVDRGERIGESWATRYERLHLHTIRRFSGLAHHGIPRRFPRYLSKDEYAAYLAEWLDGAHWSDEQDAALCEAEAMELAANARMRPLWEGV